jgi:hypothetical protein
MCRAQALTLDHSWHYSSYYRVSHQNSRVSYRGYHIYRVSHRIAIVWTIGIIVVVVGAVLALLGMAGHAVGGRRHYF